MDFSALRQSPSLGRRKRLIQRRNGMSIQIVADPEDFLGLWEILFQ